jgi:hypothetical protein
MTINDIQTFGNMLEGIEVVSSIVVRYTELETRVLIRSSVSTRQLAAALVKLYAKVLEFLADACRYYKQSSLSKLPWGIWSIYANLRRRKNSEKYSQKRQVYCGRTVSYGHSKSILGHG